MSSPDWNWLISFCLNHKDEKGKPSPLRFIPGKCEPWVEYRVPAALLQMEVTTIERKAGKVQRHPMFAGFVQMSSFESVAVNGQEA
jgi:hypothetical protein